MEYIFLLAYAVTVLAYMRKLYILLNNKRVLSALIGLFMTFFIVPDFIILDAYGISGTWVLTLLFVIIIPLLYVIRKGRLYLTKSDFGFYIMLLIVVAYAIYTRLSYEQLSDYFSSKIFGYIYSLLLPAVIVSLYKEEIVERYSEWAELLLLAVLAYAFKNYSVAGVLTFRFTYENQPEDLKNVIFAARMLGVGGILCLDKMIRKFDWKIYACFGIIILQILFFESRGPIIAFIASLGITWFICKGSTEISWKFNGKYRIAILIFIGVAVLGVRYLWTSGQLNLLVEKITNLQSGGETRYFLYPIVIGVIKEHFPFGVGFGNSKVAIMSVNSYFSNNYPHNLVLELLLEEGWIISLPFFVFFFRAFKALFTNDIVKKSAKVLIMLFLFSFINAMLSGDIAGNSWVFVFGHLICHVSGKKISTEVRDDDLYVTNLHKTVTKS